MMSTIARVGRAAKRLLGDLGRRRRVAHLDVEAHQQLDVGRVRRAGVEACPRVRSRSWPARRGARPPSSCGPRRSGRAACCARFVHNANAKPSSASVLAVDLRQQQRVLHVEVGAEEATVTPRACGRERQDGTCPAGPCARRCPRLRRAPLSWPPAAASMRPRRAVALASFEAAAIDVQLDHEQLRRLAQRRILLCRAGRQLLARRARSSRPRSISA